MAQRTIPITNWHPFAQIFPYLEGDDWTAFLASIQATNGPETPVTYRMVNGRREWLDGRNRVKACVELGIDYKTEQVEVADEDVRAYILRRNVYRRHMTPELRREIIAYLRADGMSGRSIAATLGVSNGTVQRDIADMADSTPASGDSNESTDAGAAPPVEREPGDDTEEIEQEAAAENNGKPAPLMCERCQRVGAVKNCGMCREVRKAAKPPAAKKKPKTPQPEAPAPLDPYGVEVPKRCRDAFADPWIQETIDYLEPLITEFWAKRLAGGMTARASHYPFFKEQDFVDGCAFVGNYADQLLDHLKTMRPAAVCPECVGGGCIHCRTSGLVPQSVYNELKGVE
jgi:ParB-like chromosome segregation protein Spo0J